MKIRKEVQQIVASIRDHPENWGYDDPLHTITHKGGPKIWVRGPTSVGIWGEGSVSPVAIYESMFNRKEKKLIWKTVSWFIQIHHVSPPKECDTLLAKTIEALKEDIQ